MKAVKRILGMTMGVLLLGQMISFSASCQNPPSHPAKASAKAVFDQYASRNDLTVALVSDYRIGGMSYTAVMLQADDMRAWLRLKQEFDLGEPDDALTMGFDSVGLDKLNIASMTVSSASVDTVGISSASADSIAQLIQKMGTRMISGQVTITHGTQTKAGEMVATETDTVTLTDSKLPSTPVNLMTTAVAAGDKGYVHYADSDNLTLWLFFFKDTDEMLTISKHLIEKVKRH